MNALSPKTTENLIGLPRIAEAHGSDKETEPFARAVGDCIGRIEVGILSEIYAKHPDLDDLA